MFVHVPGRRRLPVRWATPLLVLLAMAAFVALMNLEPGSTRDAAVQRWGTLSGALPASLADWHQALFGARAMRLVSALFVHAGWIHVLGNMLFLMIFGVPCERAVGGWRLLALFLFGGALANLAAALMLDAPNRVIVGASGAVSAIIGAYLALFPRASLGVVLPIGLYLEFVRVPASVLIGVWAFLQVLFSFVGPEFGAVAWSAHLVGFAFGLVYAALSRGAVNRRLRNLR